MAPLVRRATSTCGLVALGVSGLFLMVGGLVAMGQPAGGLTPADRVGNPAPTLRADDVGLASASADDELLARLVARGGCVTLEPRSYKLSRPLNLRDKKDLVLTGSGPQTRLVAMFAPGQETQPVVDMVGSEDCRLGHLRIQTTGNTPAACGLLLGRSSSASAANNAFDQVYIEGRFSVACVVNIGAELDVWTNPKLINGQPGGHNYVSGAWWPKAWQNRLRSPYGPLWAGEQWGGPDYAADGVHTFIGGWLGVYGRSGTECNLWLLPGAHFVTCTGTYFSNKPADRKDRATGGLAAVRVGTPEAPRDAFRHDGLTFTNCYFETSGARHTFLVHADAAIQITGGLLQALEDCLHEQGRYVHVTWTLNGVETRGGYAWYDWSD